MHYVKELLGASPVFDEGDRMCLGRASELIGIFMESFTKVAIEQSSSQASYLLFLSVANSYRNMWMLLGAQPDKIHRRECENDMGAILRKQSDAAIQLEYLLTDVESLAPHYIAQLWIDKKKMIDRLDRDSSDFAKRVSKSPNREFSIDQIKVELDSYKKLIGDEKIHKRQHWYAPKTLEQLAEMSCLSSQYSFWYNYLNPVVHASSISVGNGPALDGHTMCFVSMEIAMRSLQSMRKIYREHFPKALDDFLDIYQFDILRSS